MLGGSLLDTQSKWNNMEARNHDCSELHKWPGPRDHREQTGRQSGSRVLKPTPILKGHEVKDTLVFLQL